MSSKYRSDSISDLMNRVRDHHSHLDEVYGDTSQGDGFVRQQNKRKQLPTPQHTVEQAYAKSLAHQGGIEMFGRGRPRSHRVWSSGAHALPTASAPATKTAFAMGKPMLAPPSRRAQTALPQWMGAAVAQAEAVDIIEDRARQAYLRLQSRTKAQGASQSAQAANPPEQARATTAQPHAPSRHPDDQVELPVGYVSSTDATSVNFQYTPGGSFYESLFAGARSVSGEGAPVQDREATQTFIFGRPYLG